jgi:Ubiquitin-2 like Rad60 SUMO-like
VVPAVRAGDEVHFKVKPTTKFEKIFNAWKTRKAVQTGVRFVVDGVQLHEHRTPGEHQTLHIPHHFVRCVWEGCSPGI